MSNSNKSKKVSGNPDVNVGADEGAKEVEINTGGLGDRKEIDLDRSGPSESKKDFSKPRNVEDEEEDLGDFSNSDESDTSYRKQDSSKSSESPSANA